MLHAKGIFNLIWFMVLLLFPQKAILHSRELPAPLWTWNLLCRTELSWLTCPKCINLLNLLFHLNLGCNLVWFFFCPDVNSAQSDWKVLNFTTMREKVKLDLWWFVIRSPICLNGLDFQRVAQFYIAFLFMSLFCRSFLW